jgi:hypothetical protein
VEARQIVSPLASFVFQRISDFAGSGPDASYLVGSAIPASANASRRSTQVPHFPQCTAPPL